MKQKRCSTVRLNAKNRATLAMLQKTAHSNGRRVSSAEMINTCLECNLAFEVGRYNRTLAQELRNEGTETPVPGTYSDRPKNN